MILDATLCRDALGGLNSHLVALLILKGQSVNVEALLLGDGQSCGRIQAATQQYHGFARHRAIPPWSRMISSRRFQKVVRLLQRQLYGHWIARSGHPDKLVGFVARRTAWQSSRSLLSLFHAGLPRRGIASRSS